VSSLVMHLVEDDDERDDEGVVDARVDGDAVRVLPQQRAHHAEPPVDLQVPIHSHSVEEHDEQATLIGEEESAADTTCLGDDGVGVAERDGAGAVVVAAGDPEVAGLLGVVAGEEDADLGRPPQLHHGRLHHGEQQVPAPGAVAPEHLPPRAQHQRLRVPHPHPSSSRQDSGRRSKREGDQEIKGRRIGGEKEQRPIPGR
jgi:hypothetical protein